MSIRNNRFLSRRFSNDVRVVVHIWWHVTFIFLFTGFIFFTAASFPIVYLLWTPHDPSTWSAVALGRVLLLLLFLRFLRTGRFRLPLAIEKCCGDWGFCCCWSSAVVRDSLLVAGVSNGSVDEGNDESIVINNLYFRQVNQWIRRRWIAQSINNRYLLRLLHTTSNLWSLRWYELFWSEIDVYVC